MRFRSAEGKKALLTELFRAIDGWASQRVVVGIDEAQFEAED